MSKKQRLKNRVNAEKLRRITREKELSTHVCENCGELGGHWISTRPTSLMALITGQDDQEGFWTCPKYYGSDGRRIES